MIYSNYHTHRTYFGSKVDNNAVAKIKSSTTPELHQFIDKLANKIENWGDSESVITLAKENNSNRHRFVIRNRNFGTKEVGISMPVRDNELIHAFININERIIKSAENFLKKQ